MIGLQSEATLRLKVELDSKDISGVKTLLKDLSNAFKAQSAAKGMSALEQSLVRTREELKKVKSELNAMKRAASGTMSAAAKAAKEEADAEKFLAAVLARRMAAAQAATRATTAAATAARISTAQAKNEAIMLQRLVAVSVAVANAKNNVASRTAATTAAAKAQAAATQAQVDANKQALITAIALATREKALADAKRIAVAVDKQSVDFKKKNVDLIIALAKAEKLDTAAIIANNNAAIRAIQLAKQRKSALEGIRSALSFVGKLSEAVSKAEHEFDALFRAAFRLQMAGSTVSNFGRDIIRVGTDIMNVFGDFEYTMLRAAGSLSIFYDAEQKGMVGFTQLREAILTLSNDMMLFPAKEVAEALYFWGSATGQAVESQEDLAASTKALDTIMKASIMTNTGYEATIKGVYSILTQFYGGALEYATEVTEGLFYTTQRTAAEFEDLINSFKMIGPVAAQMGVSFNEVRDTLGVLADLGIRGTMAGRGLRQLFIQTLRPSGPAKSALNEAFAALDPEVFSGKSYKELVFLDGQYVGITKHIEILAKATEDMESADRQALLAKIATANELPILSALIGKQRALLLGLADANDKYTSSAEEAAAFFEKNWHALAQSWNALEGSIQRAIETLKIEVGAIIMEALRPFINTLTDVIDTIIELVEQNPEIGKMVSQFLALTAAIAVIGGTVLTATGAIIGLATAIGLIVKSTSEWHGTILKLAGAFTFVFLAIIDNFEYIQDAAGRIMENLAEAFNGASVGADELANMMESLLAPARAVFDLFIRAVVFVAELASEVLVLVSAFNELTGGHIFNAIVVGLSAIFSARMLISIATMIGSITGLTKAFALLGITSKGMNLTALSGMFTRMGVAVKGAATAVKTLNFASMAGGISRAAGALGSFMGGPVGWLALGISLVALAGDIPIVRDLLDTLGSAFRNINDEIAKSVESFGEYGPELERRIRENYNTIFGVDAAKSANDAVDAQISLLQKRLEKTTTTIAAMGSEELPEFAKDKSRGWIKRFTAQLQQRQQNLQANLDSLIATRNSVPNLGILERSVLEGVASDMEALTKASEEFNSISRESGEALRLTSDEYGRLVTTISKSSGMLPSQAGETLNFLNAQLGENITASELRGVYERFSSTMFANWDWASFFDVASELTNVGEISSSVNDMLVKAMQNVDIDSGDSKKIAMQLAEGLPFLRDFSIADVAAGNVDKLVTPEARAMAQALMAAWQEGISGELENPTMSMDDVANRIKSSTASLISSTLKNAFPDAGFFSEQVQAAILTQDYETVSSLFLNEVLPSGESLMSALDEEGARLGSVGPALIELVKTLVDQNLATPELRAAAAEIFHEEGEVIGGASRASLVEGIISGLESTKFDGAAIRKMKKMGSIQDVLARIGKNLSKTRKVAFGKGANFASRTFYNEQVEEGMNAFEAALHAKGGNAAAQRRITRAYINSLVPRGGLAAMPRQARNRLANQLGEILSIDPEEIKLPTSRKSLISLLLAGGAGDDEGGGAGASPFAPAVAEAISSVSSDPTVKTAAKTIGTNIQTDMTAGINTGKVNVTGYTVSVTSAMLAAGPAFMTTGGFLASRATSGFVSTILKNSGMYTASLNVAIAVASVALSIRVWFYGQKVGQAWGAGVAAGIRSKNDEIARAAEDATPSIKGGSPPKVGPLKHIDDWGYNIGAAWGEGLTKGAVTEASKVAREVRMATMDRSEMRGFRGDVEHTSRREVTVKLEVSSPDGTVNRQKQSEVRRGALEALTVAGLEHFVTVG